MRQRALIHVEGPAGAGKTTLIEVLLRRLGEVVICVRATRDDSLRTPMESQPKMHPELRRYRAAGASGVALYRFPPSHTDTDAFFVTNFMQDYSSAVFIEGDSPLEYVNLAVFVAPPLPAGTSLLRRILREHATRHTLALDGWERALESPAKLGRLLTGGFGEPLLEAALADPGAFEQTRAEMVRELARLRAAPPPGPTEHWALIPSHVGIEQAQLVVVSARDDDERSRGHLLAQEVGRLRKDDAVFKDVLGFRGSRVPVTAVVANLAIPEDAGLKKTLARVKRAMRSVR